MLRTRQQSSTSYPINFLMVLSVDHSTGATGKTVTVTLSKNGAAFGSASGAVTEITNGWYSLAGNATDRATLGELAVHATATGCDNVDFVCNIITVDPFAAQIGLTLPTNFTSLSIDASGRVDLGLWRGVQPLALNSNEVQVAPDWSNILNATSTIALTNTTIKNVTGTPPDSAGVTTLLLRIASALSISAGAVTVGTVASGAIAAASFAANALDAVWSTTARTLTAFSFTVNANMVGIIATALTETTTGWLTAAFKKFFNLAAPTSTMNEITLVDTTTDLTNNNPTIGNVTLAASQPNYAPSKAGDQMDLVNAPNATAVTAIQAGLSKPAIAQTIDQTKAIGTPTAGTIAEALSKADTLTFTGSNVNANANVFASGALQAATSTTATLALGTTGSVNGLMLEITSGAAQQAVPITGYNTGTLVATVVWVNGTPAALDTYRVIVSGGSSGGTSGDTATFSNGAATQIDFIEAQVAKIGSASFTQNSFDLLMSNQGIVAGTSYKLAYGNQITFTISNLLIGSNLSVVYEVNVNGVPTTFTATLTTEQVGLLIGYFEINGANTATWGPTTNSAGYPGEVAVYNTAVMPHDKINVVLRPLTVASGV